MILLIIFHFCKNLNKTKKTLSHLEEKNNLRAMDSHYLQAFTFFLPKFLLNIYINERQLPLNCIQLYAGNFNSFLEYYLIVSPLHQTILWKLLSISPVLNKYCVSILIDC